MHPFSGNSKLGNWKIPEFSSDRDRRRVCRGNKEIGWTASQPFIPADEEKGLKRTREASAPGAPNVMPPSHHRQLSVTLSGLGSSSLGMRNDAPVPKESSSDVWNRAMQNVFEKAGNVIDMNGKGIGSVPASILDIKYFSPLGRPGTASVKRNKRSLGPSQTEPTLVGKKGMAAQGGEMQEAQGGAGPNFQIFLAHNQLTSNRISPALWMLQSTLTVLSLRNNFLSYLSPAVGQLSALVELNVSGNALTYLPAEILQLRNLRRIMTLGNPFKSRRDEQLVLDRGKKRLFSSKVRRTPTDTISLYETCMQTLMSADSGKPRCLMCEMYPTKPAPLDEMPPDMALPLQGIYASRKRYAADSYEWWDRNYEPEEPRVAYVPEEHVCASPAHVDVRHFSRAAVTQFEWVCEGDLIRHDFVERLQNMHLDDGADGSDTEPEDDGDTELEDQDVLAAPLMSEKRIPLLHRGCTPRCLDYLTM